MIQIIFAIIYLAIGVTVRLTQSDTMETLIVWCMCIIIANIYLASLFVSQKDKEGV